MSTIVSFHAIDLAAVQPLLAKPVPAVLKAARAAAKDWQVDGIEKAFGQVAGGAVGKKLAKGDPWEAEHAHTLDVAQSFALAALLQSQSTRVGETQYSSSAGNAFRATLKSFMLDAFLLGRPIFRALCDEAYPYWGGLERDFLERLVASIPRSLSKAGLSDDEGWLADVFKAARAAEKLGGDFLAIAL